MIDASVLVLIGTVVTALAAPALMALLVHRNAMTMRAQDWERQDEVQERADAAAARSASLIAELNQSTHEATKITVGKLDVIHTLVNSTLTAAMQVSLDGVRRELILMERDPTSDPVLVVNTQRKIEDLERIIEERNRQTAVANLQDQKIEAAKASEAVGIIVPPAKPQLISLGDVTERVLAGDPPPVTSSQIKKQDEAAAATVKAAGKTVEAAAETVEAMKKDI